MFKKPVLAVVFSAALFCQPVYANTGAKMQQLAEFVAISDVCGYQLNTDAVDVYIASIIDTRDESMVNAIYQGVADERRNVSRASADEVAARCPKNIKFGAKHKLIAK